MRPDIEEINYLETYYFANIINNILREPYNYLRGLNDFFGDEKYKNFLNSFPKTSAFHYFIMFIIDSICYEDIEESTNEKFLNGKRKLWVEVALEYHDFKFDSFDLWLKENDKNRYSVIDDDIVEYLNHLQWSGPYEDLLEKMAKEIFFILFLNRECLQNFNSMISTHISDVQILDLEESEKVYFKRDGVLKRVNIPKWVKRAIIHRDRGMCVNCHKDLTGIISIGGIENFDHIIPLAKGGINDVTNIQLLCQDCNKIKLDKLIKTSNKYESWY